MHVKMPRGALCARVGKRLDQGFDFDCAPEVGGASPPRPTSIRWLSQTRTEVAEPLANLADGLLPGKTQAVMPLPILFLIAGLLVGVAFGFDVGRKASGLASWHFRTRVGTRATTDSPILGRLVPRPFTGGRSGLCSALCSSCLVASPWSLPSALVAANGASCRVDRMAQCGTWPRS